MTVVEEPPDEKKTGARFEFSMEGPSMTGGRWEALAAKSAGAASQSWKSRRFTKGGDGGAGLPLDEEVWRGGDEDARTPGDTVFLFLGGMVEVVVVEAFATT
jgi:hypothetical protein